MLRYSMITELFNDFIFYVQHNDSVVVLLPMFYMSRFFYFIIFSIQFSCVFASSVVFFIISFNSICFSFIILFIIILLGKQMNRVINIEIRSLTRIFYRETFDCTLKLFETIHDIFHCKFEGCCKLILEPLLRTECRVRAIQKSNKK